MKDFAGTQIFIGNVVKYKLKSCCYQFDDVIYQIFQNQGAVQLNTYHDKVYLHDCDYLYKIQRKLENF